MEYAEYIFPLDTYKKLVVERKKKIHLYMVITILLM